MSSKMREEEPGYHPLLSGHPPAAAASSASSSPASPSSPSSPISSSKEGLCGERGDEDCQGRTRTGPVVNVGVPRKSPLSRLSSPLAFCFVSLLLVHQPKGSLAGSSCLGKCACVYKSNKLISDCGGLGLTKLPDITKIDKQVDSEIQVINLTRNNFVELRANIFFSARLLNLQRIYLSKVGLERIDNLAFYRLANLVELDLSSNSLQLVPSSAFEPIPKLWTLDLGKNQIEKLTSNSFLYLPVLKTLSLERNRIKSIEENAFAGLKELQVLRLSDNQLTYLGSKIFLPVTKLHELTLSENKWHCDCRMRDLREFLLVKGVPSGSISVPDSPKCANLNKVWTQLSLDAFLCAPRISPNHSSSIYQVEQGKNLELECRFFMDEGVDQQQLTIKWFWQDRPITNNSEGVVQPQQFRIIEYDSLLGNKTQRKVRVSRLEITFILELNQGIYWCQAKNGAGADGQNFTVLVITPQQIKKNTAMVAAASSSDSINKSDPNGLSIDDEKPGPSPNSVVIGLVLGILFGIFLVLVLFGVAVVVLCRRKQHRRRSTATMSRVVAAESELEKLTSSTISGSSVGVTGVLGTNGVTPTLTTTLINPVQKPPRLGFATTPTTPTGTPQVWLIKRNNNTTGSANGSAIRSDGDGCCETPLTLQEYDTATITTISTTIEPDVIHHPSAYVRSHLIPPLDSEQISIHSDGTEV